MRAAVADPASNVTSAGGSPASIAPVSLTATVTVSGAVASPVRLNVNAASAPSVTGDAPPAIETAGVAADAGPGTVSLSVPDSTFSSAVQIAPLVPQARPPASTTVTSPWVFGWM